MTKFGTFQGTKFIDKSGSASLIDTCRSSNLPANEKMRFGILTFKGAEQYPQN
jgi:hypothetical protein